MKPLRVESNVSTQTVSLHYNEDTGEIFGRKTVQDKQTVEGFIVNGTVTGKMSVYGVYTKTHQIRQTNHF